MLQRLSTSVRQLAKPSTLRSLSAATSRQFGTSPVSEKNLRVWQPFDDTFFNMASRLMRNLEREFDWVSRQAINYNPSSKLFPSEGASALESAFNNSVVTDKDGNRKFQLALDLRDFTPEEIKVKTHGHTINISAKKESQSADQYYLREFSQSYTLPKELKLEDLKSQWTDEGCLIVEAPLPKQVEAEKTPKVKEIPIEHGAQPSKAIEGNNKKK